MSWIYKLPWNLIEQAASDHNLDPLVIGALVQQESAGDELAVRFEPGWRYTFSTQVFANACHISPETEEVCQQISWGLMQIMGGTARDLGLKQNPLTALADPEVNLHYGCKFLKRQLKRYQNNEMDAIAAYNAGAARKDQNGIYQNERYVDSVYQKLRQLRGK